MRRLPTLLLLLMVATSATAADWFVRVLGGTAAQCTGHTDQNYDGGAHGTACAYANPQDALTNMNCATPDHVYIRDGTYVGNYTVKPICQATDTNTRLIIEGNASDPNAVTLDGSGGTIALYSVGGTGSYGNRSKFITIKNIRIIAGTEEGIQFNGTHEGIDFDNLRIDVPNATCCAHPPPISAGIYHGPDQGCWGCKITNTVITGTGTTTIKGLTGTDAQGINFTPLGSGCTGCTQPPTSYFQNNTITKMLGSCFGGNYSNSYIENNRCKTTVSHGDDGGFQLYNSANAVIRFNLFEDIRCDETDNYGVFFSIRSTNETDATKVANAFIYNNTIVGSSANTDHSLGEKYFYMDDIIHPSSEKTYFVNNIVIRNFGVDLSTYGSFSGFADKHAALIADCGTTLPEIGHNIVDDIGWRDNGTRTEFMGLWMDVDEVDCNIDPNTMGNLIGTDPSLEATNWTPDNSADLPCGAGDTTVVAPDGGTSKSWIGYAQGACLVGGPGSIIKGVTVTGGTVH